MDRQELDNLLQQLGTQIPRDKEQDVIWTFDKAVYFAMTCVTTIGGSNSHILIWAFIERLFEDSFGMKIMYYVIFQT